jgi:hypothetical protein
LPVEVVDEVAPDLRSRIVGLASDGCSLHTVAAILNSEGLRTPRGLRWHSRSVARCLAAPTGVSVTGVTG